MHVAGTHGRESALGSWPPAHMSCFSPAKKKNGILMLPKLGNCRVAVICHNPGVFHFFPKMSLLIKVIRKVKWFMK